MKNLCIYCKKEGKSKEYAFPSSLLHKCIPLNKSAPEWIIQHLCEDCNNALGKLDNILATRSSMAFIWRKIKNEWKSNQTDNKSGPLASSFYNAKAHGINPVRLFYPDPLYGNLIVLHEEIETSAPGFHPTSVVVRAQTPQMILTQYVEGQTGEKIREENCEKWDAGELFITESDEHEGVYCISGNTYVFPPKTTQYFVNNPDREQEFKSKFLKKRDNIRYDLNIIFPDDYEDSSKLKGFYERLNASTEELIEWQNCEPKELPQEIMVVVDQKAVPYIDRAIVKIAFHCFLYHYSQFSGHEPMFNDVKAFIKGKEDSHEETSKEFVTQVRVSKNYVWDSNEHFHILRFYVNGNNIVCQIAFFTGLLVGPFASGITLAGDFDKAIQGPYREVLMPFYVHGKSELIRRRLVEDLDRKKNIMQKTELQQQAVTLIQQLSVEDLKVAIDYLTILQDKDGVETQLASDSETDKSSASKSLRKNPSAQRLIKVMEQPPHVTDEDIEELLKGIKEARQPTQFESPFDGIEDSE